jgi:hypothetical protein
VETRLAACSELPEERVGAVSPERMHERSGADIAVGPGEPTAVEVAGSAGEGERAVDDTGGRFADESLCALRLGKEARQVIGRAGRGRVPRLVLVDQGSGAREEGSSGGEVDDVLGGEHLRMRIELGATAELVGHTRVAAWKRPALRFRSMYSTASPTGKPPRRAESGSSTFSKETEWLPEARLPSASQSLWTTTPAVSRGRSWHSRTAHGRRRRCR